MAGISDALQKKLISELMDANTLGLLLVGSYEWGNTSPHSDIDIERYVYRMPPDDSEQLTLKLYDGYMVSVTTTTTLHQYDNLNHAERALWRVPSLRNGIIMHDPTGEIAKLKAVAADWQPNPIKGNLYAGYMLFRKTEDVYKLLRALEQEDEATIALICFHLTFDLTRMIAIHHQLLIESDVRLFAQVQEIVGKDSPWARWLAIAMGLKTDMGADSPLEERAIGGFNLYRETVTLLSDILSPEHRGLIDDVLVAIQASGYV